MNGMSPSEIVLVVQLEMFFLPRTQIFYNGEVKPMWKEIWRKREDTLRTRFGRQIESLQTRMRDLIPLNVGDKCRVQNQIGQFAN